MGASWVLPSVTSSTGHSVSFFELLPCNYWGAFLKIFSNVAFYFAWSFEVCILMVFINIAFYSAWYLVEVQMHRCADRA